MNKILSILLAISVTFPLWAADHAEAPAARSDPSADLNDIYAFVNPNDAGEFIVAATVHPRATTATRFSDAVSYVFYIDNAAGGQFEFTCTVEAGVRLNCAGSNGASVNGPIETVLSGTDLRAFAGLREDPFYLDGPALVETLTTGQAAFTDPGVDSFAGFNLLAIVLGIPISTITDGTDASNLTLFWGATERLASTAGINGSMSGPWVVLDESGEIESGQGFVFEVVDTPDDPENPTQFFATFYGFLGGDQLWLAGNSALDATPGTTATVPVLSLSGGDFVPDYEGNQVVGKTEGNLVVSFDSANSGSVSFEPAEGSSLPAFEESIARLANIQGLSPSLPTTAGQVDRMGRAAVATALIPSGMRDDYNADGDPAGWVDQWASTIEASLVFADSLDGIDGNILTGDEAFLSTVLADDRLLTRLDIADCEGGYLAVEAGIVTGTEPTLCGGRTLDQDVVDVTLTVLVSGGEIVISDNVDANDVDSTIGVFPFLGSPQ